MAERLVLLIVLVPSLIYSYPQRHKALDHQCLAVLVNRLVLLHRFCFQFEELLTHVVEEDLAKAVQTLALEVVEAALSVGKQHPSFQSTSSQLLFPEDVRSVVECVLLHFPCSDVIDAGDEAVEGSAEEILRIVTC